MGALTISVMALALAGSAQKHDEPPTDSVARWQPYIAEASARFGLPAGWIGRVMHAESAGRTMIDGHPIRSRAGAIGVMQLMPATWAALRRQQGLGDDPDNPHDNIIAGTAYLRALYDRFGYPGLFAAYNAGPARYAAHLASGRALPGETRIYLARVTGSGMETPSKVPGDSVKAVINGVFFDLVSANIPPSASDPSRRSDGLFVVRSGAPRTDR